MINLILWGFAVWGGGSPDLIDMPAQSFFNPPDNFEIIDRWPYGPGFSIDIDGDTLFYTNGAVLQIGEIGINDELTWLSEQVFSGLAYTMARSGDRLYVAVDDQGIAIVNIKSLEYPEIINQFQTQGRVFGLAARGDTVYACMGSEGLAVYDCRQPANPMLIGSFTGNNLRRLKLKNDLLYITDRALGLRIIDVSNPENPVEVSSIGLTGQHEGIELDTFGNTAWVCSFDGNINVVDISDSTQPEPVSVIPVFVAWAIDLDSTNAYVVTWNDSLAVVNLDSYEIVQSIDLDTYEEDGTWPYDISTDKDNVCIAGYLGSWWIFDFEDIKNPEYTDGFMRGGVAQEITVSENWIILGLQGARIALFTRAGDPEPVFIQTIPDWPNDLQVRKDTLFAGLGWSGFATYLLPDNSQDTIDEITRLVYEHLYVEAFALADSFACLAARDSGVVVVDISDPEGFTELARLSFSSRVMSVCLNGDILYAGLETGGVCEIDVSTPSDPVKLASHPADGAVIDISLYGDLLFTAQGNLGVSIYDISSGWNRVSGIPSEKVIRKIVRAEDLIFLADGSAGISAYSITDPYSPEIKGHLNTGGDVRDIAYYSDTLALADGYDGLALVRYTCDCIDGDRIPTPEVEVCNPIFSSELKFNQSVQARLFDASGRCRSYISGDRFDGDSLEPGVYFLQGRDWSAKVIKIH
ncbi:hypothetical protein GF359_03050 [candidate division WOR-3 bacterium]|uniref:T9SS type A sorting domain-containing protein n=1 Tax=candidate division WOR-3 bacterium TaxID=2052148 RepID=A0A9D5K8D2_UNCW3|nr:hypothetical protein [candidate division WOR-3 bacterium]MBD3364172.1 hypothetical protein [candidate division WOR-3 bacterium]